MSTMIDSEECKPLIIKGSVIPYYFVTPNGEIWSCKTGKYKKMTPAYSSGYAKTQLRINGKAFPIYFHKVVCETLVPFKRPKEISKKDWDVTPESVKQHMKNLYFVNHIDHNRANFHPSNLEWVTSQENAQAYQKHSKGK